MKKALTVMSTDWHIKPSNHNEILELIGEQIELAKKLKVTEHICLGDVFESRQAQPLVSLKTFEYIVDMFDAAGHKLTVFPGNHDKTNYKSEDSFLDPFKKRVSVISVADVCKKEPFTFVHIPFFTDEIWLEELKKIEKDCNAKNSILFSHRAFNGSVNNDGSEVETSISPKIVSEFKKVFLGHYHDKQQIGENVFHIPSIKQNNFGENIQKGFTVLYDDGSHELIKSTFKEYRTVDVDLNSVSKKEINSLKKKYAESSHNVRFKFAGSAEKVKAISKDEFGALGISVITKEDDLVYSDNIDVQRFDSENIVKLFEQWCADNEKDFKVGIRYINQKLN